MASPKLDDRISHGAVVREMALVEERLHFERLCGARLDGARQKLRKCLVGIGWSNIELCDVIVVLLQMLRQIRNFGKKN